MRNSIGMKLFVGIMIFILMIVTISWIFHTKYIEEYYLQRKKENLIQYEKEIENTYKENPQNLNDTIGKIENVLGGNVVIISSNDSFYGHGKGKMGVMLSQEVFKRVLQGEKVMETFEHPKWKVKFLVFAAPIDDKIIILQSSIASIQESVMVAKEFYIYIGIFSLMLGTFMAFWYAKKFTKPIVALNEVAKDLAKLKFDTKYEGNRKDEIGQLGNTMNSLSHQLNETIKALNISNEQLKKDIEKRKRMEELRKEFIANVSHELKSPIALIKGYAEGLLENIVQDEKSKKFYCHVIIDETDQMDQLVKDLLELSKLDSENIKLQVEPFSIEELIQKIYQKYNYVFMEKNIKGQIQKNGNSWIAIGDPYKLEQVILNFINNGIHHIGKERKLVISLEEKKETIRIGIYNTGDFIPKEEMDKIWDSFYKIDKARTRELGGTGLGLSIVKGILKLHKSSFGVENKKDGVEFWFEIKKGDQ
ncbi:sensor histidine kinase [Inediibacterium massiliense]|uniref:sensor histidine kinase n=1 Tax=Inediibacterium massiliense TaxID=1658111 RepID=UPI0006B5B223|nr:HAMP domain-containing sensor histidine kinase [Inediibacterium massiliense]